VIFRAIFVGSRIDQVNLCRYLEDKRITLKPLLDETNFSFEDPQKAFDHLYSAKHVGKVVIRV
jgi:NADPH:quinone reductase-like Zn-dependent oxidoreductase